MLSGKPFMEDAAAVKFGVADENRQLRRRKPCCCSVYESRELEGYSILATQRLPMEKEHTASIQDQYQHPRAVQVDRWREGATLVHVTQSPHVVTHPDNLGRVLTTCLIALRSLALRSTLTSPPAALNSILAIVLQHQPLCMNTCGDWTCWTA